VLDRRVLTSLCDWPAKTVQVATALKSAIDSDKNDLGPFSCPEKSSANEIKLADLEVESALLPAHGAFKKYCNECHGRDSDIPLKLDSIGYLKSYRGVYEQSVMKVLEGGAMPPKSALQPSVEERQAMINALKSR